jgi:aspartyl-tRNA(Asn)/glutamyl-tRNA(Gln) amidotransferase subunit C
MLTDQEIKHIAKLARIELSEAEEQKLKKDLTSVLGYIDKLSEVDTSSVEPLYQVTGLTNAFRPDEHRKDFEMSEKLNELLIGQAPSKQGRFVKVKSVLKK